MLKNNRIQRRVYELLSRAATSGTSAPGPGQRELHFIFFQKPDRFLESDDKPGHVAGVQFEKTVLKGDHHHKRKDFAVIPWCPHF